MPTATTARASVLQLLPLYLVNFIFYLTLYGFFRMVLVYMADAFHMPVEQSTLTYSSSPSCRWSQVCC